MNINEDHFILSPEQQRFQSMLLPALLTYFDFRTRELDITHLEKDLPLLSPGEQLMARFFAGIWLGANQFNFDLAEAMKHLRDDEVQQIRAWIADPFCP